MIQAAIRQFLPPHGEGGDRDRPGGIEPSSTSPGEDLPYKVEIWDEAGAFPERVIAITSSLAVGYAAYYAAAREHPGRVITLRHKGNILSRWSDKIH